MVSWVVGEGCPRVVGSDGGGLGRGGGGGGGGFGLGFKTSFFF